MEDRRLTCLDCGRNFVFSSSEQDFYAEKGFSHDPKRCADCRLAKRGNEAQQLFAAICAECGSQTQVPFKPSGAKPVLCRECFKRSR